MAQNKHVWAICCQPEVAGDVISTENVKTTEGYAVLNFEAAGISSSENIKISHLRTDVGPLKSHFFRSQGAAMSNRLHESKEALESQFPKL